MLYRQAADHDDPNPPHPLVLVGQPALHRGQPLLWLFADDGLQGAHRHLVGILPGDTGAAQLHHQRDDGLGIGQFHRPQEGNGDDAALATIAIPQQTRQWDEITHTLAGDLADLPADGFEYGHRGTDRFLLLPLLGLDTSCTFGLELEPEAAQRIGGGTWRGRVVGCENCVNLVRGCYLRHPVPLF